MAYGISVKENIDAFIIKQRLVSKINMLPEAEAQYLVGQLAILIDKSLNQGEQIDDKNVDKNFVTFLLRLFY
jgi:hypothetical protein